MGFCFCRVVTCQSGVRSEGLKVQMGLRLSFALVAPMSNSPGTNDIVIVSLTAPPCCKLFDLVHETTRPNV